MEALGLGDELVPTAGVWLREGDLARFTPRFAPVAGTQYAVLARADRAGRWQEQARIVVPGAPTVRSAFVRSIDPGGDWVPANLLRFHVSFSTVMEEGTAAGRIHLRDASGQDIRGALFSMAPEFWDRERRQLTVLLEPGRLKRGLRPHLLAGEPLVEGSTVTLAVDPEIRDSAGVQLAEGAQRTYRVGPAVRTRVDPARWSIRWPGRGHDHLVVRFDRPLDRALVRRCLVGLDEHERPLTGRHTIDAQASEWTFTPTGQVGSLRIDTRLEDLAGNSVRRIFDRDLQHPDDNDRIEAASIILQPDGTASTGHQDPLGDR